MSQDSRRAATRVSALITLALGFLIAFTYDPAAVAGWWGSVRFQPAAMAPAPNAQNDDEDGGGGSEGEPEIGPCDINRDGEISDADMEALLLAIKDPDGFKEMYGYDPVDMLAALDADQDKEITEEEIYEFGAGGCGAIMTDGAGMTGCGVAGTPRRWQAGIPVSPFASVNMLNGNMLTAIPLVAWDPVGPPVGFAVYHNSLATTCSNGSATTGFSLGNGWSCSYSARVEGSYGSNVTVVRDDGTRDDYTYSAGNYSAPAGVFDRLTYASSTWTLTSPAQSKFRFDALHSGRLIDITDSSGNVSTVHYTTGNDIDYVDSAIDDNSTVFNRLEFRYVSGKLDEIEDAIGRIWQFNYTSNRLTSIDFPTDTWVSATDIVIAYTLTGDRISSTTSRDNKTWSYAYNSTTSKLSTVTDPGPSGSPYTQSFSFASSTIGGLYYNTYTDRRSKAWTFKFDTSDDLKNLINPMSTNNTRSFTYDSNHNRLTITNELSKTWTFTYGSVGNVATIQSPMTGGDAQTWTYTWAQPDPTNRPNFWRCTQVTDPLSDYVQFAYADSNDPTHVTTITEMIPETGGSTTATTIEYYGSSDTTCRGQLKKVTDGNGVEHKYEYDSLGYFAKLSEGLLTGSDNYPVFIDQTNDECGQVKSGKSIAGGGDRTFDVNNNDHPLTGLYVYCVLTLTSDLTRLSAKVPDDCSFETTPPYGSLSTATYDDAGRPTQLISALDTSTIQGMDFIQTDFAYDSALGRPTGVIKTVGNGTEWSVARDFDYTGYDANSNLLTRVGPDGESTTYTYDNINRLKTITRGSGGTVMDAEYFYVGHRLDKIEYANGTYETRTYDDADRLLTIVHKDAATTTRFSLTYTWNKDNTVATRTEYDYTTGTGHTAVTTFTYDHRKRLRTEERILDSTTTVYDLEYTYDGLGNRVTKVDTTNPSVTKTTAYSYDTNSSNRESAFQTNNNRLLKTEESWAGSSTVLKRTVNYKYYNTGHCSNIIVKDTYTSGDPGSSGDYDWYYDIALQYNRYDQLWRVQYDNWKVNGSGEFTDYTKLSAKEFFYEDGRERWLARDVDPNDGYAPAATWKWTDYSAQQPYGDFEYTISEDPDPPVELTRYLDAMGTQAIQTVSGGATKYLHGDVTRSTNATSDGSTGSYATSTYAYTAFGEKIGSGDPTASSRYGYDGGWGYESGLLSLQGSNTNLTAITLQHVGARWYQPGIGRFVQRDPIGLRGGANAYAYCSNQPTTRADPNGFDWTDAGPWIHNHPNGSPAVDYGARDRAKATCDSAWEWWADGWISWGDEAGKLDQAIKDVTTSEQVSNLSTDVGVVETALKSNNAGTAVYFCFSGVYNTSNMFGFPSWTASWCNYPPPPHSPGPVFIHPGSTWQ